MDNDFCIRANLSHCLASIGEDLGETSPVIACVVVRKDLNTYHSVGGLIAHLHKVWLCSSVLQCLEYLFRVGIDLVGLFCSSGAVAP